MYLAIVVLPEDPNGQPVLHIVEMDPALDEFALRLDDGLVLIGVIDSIPPVIVVGPEREEEAEWVMQLDEERHHILSNWQWSQIWGFREWST